MKGVHECSGTDVSPAEVDSKHPQLCSKIFLKAHSKEFVFYTWGIIHFPSCLILEVWSRCWSYRSVYGITSGFPQQVLKKGSVISPADDKKKLWFPQAGVIQMLKGWFPLQFKQIQELQDFSWTLNYIQRSDVTVPRQLFWRKDLVSRYQIPQFPCRVFRYKSLHAF